jgi:hypothetical protein
MINTYTASSVASLLFFSMASYIYAGLFALTFILIYRLSRIGRRPANFPPGPPTLPLIGNLHLMPKEKAHLQFQIWAEEYGPVYSLTLGTKVMVVLNTDQAVKDLLDKRSGIYSSRPDMYISRIAGGGMRFSLMVCPTPSYLPYRSTFAMALLNTNTGVRRKMAHDPQNRAQDPQHQRSKGVCALPRLGK